MRWPEWAQRETVRLLQRGGSNFFPSYAAGEAWRYIHAEQPLGNFLALTWDDVRPVSHLSPARCADLIRNGYWRCEPVDSPMITPRRARPRGGRAAWPSHRLR